MSFQCKVNDHEIGCHRYDFRSVTRDTVETAIRELADLVKQYCGGTFSTAFLDKDHREIKLI